MANPAMNPSELIAAQIPVEQVAWDDLKPAAETLQRAFGNNPIMRYMAAAARKPEREILEDFSHILTRARVNGVVMRTSKRHEGIAVWFLGGFARSSLRSNIAIACYKLQTFHLQDMLRLIPFYLKIEREHARIIHKPHYYLELLGVDPRYQGQGFASKLLRPVLSHADQEGKACYLETQSAQNVALYQHFGFEVVGEIPVFFDEIPYSLMLRTPRSSFA